MKIIKKIFIWIIAIIFFSFAIIMTVMLLNQNEFGVTQISDSSYILINDNIANESYKEGDLVVVNERRVTDIAVGDEIFVYRVAKDDTVTIEIGKVGEVLPEEDLVALENGATFASKFIVGESSYVIPVVGNFLGFILSQWGFLFLVVVPCFLVFVYQLYTLIIEIKYGEEEVIAPNYRY